MSQISVSLGYFCKVIWDKVFKNGPSKTFGRQPLKILNDMVCLQLPTGEFRGMLSVPLCPWNFEL